MTKKDLSIVVVTWNTKNLLLKCIDAITRSKPKVNYEIIVVDNGSEERERLKTDERDARIIQNEKNLGFAKANNQGMKVAKGKYILLLNSDTEVKKGAIDALYDFSRIHKDAGVVGSRLLNADGSIQPSVFKFPTLFSAVRQYWFGEKGSYGAYSPLEKRALEVDVVVGASFLITPSAFKKVGLLNEDYFFFFEDLDYCRKVKKSGLKVYYLPKSEVVHYHGSTIRKMSGSEHPWEKLVPGSKTYHGSLMHYLINFVIWTGQKMGRFTGEAGQASLIPLILVSLLMVPAFYNLLRPGYFPMQDDLQAFRVHQMDRCFDDFQIPCRWVPDAGYQYGYPQFNYYPPLPYYLGALLHRAGFEYIDSVKILFVAGYILSAITMYALVSTLLKSSWAGIVASALYTYIPYKAVEVYVRGALSEFWAQIFFPLIFWAIYKLIKSGKTKYIVWLSVSTGLLATTHSLMTMIFAGVAVLWTAYWLFREKWNNLFKVIWGGILGFGLSAFFILPVIFERKFAHVESLLSGYFDYRQHFVSLYKLFLSMEWGYGSSGFPDEKLNLSLGIVQWIVGLCVVIIALIKFRKERKFSVLTLLLSGVTLVTIFMMHMKSSFIWAKLPYLWYLQFPWRFLAISIFLLCLLSGFLVYFSGKFKYVLGLILIAISLALNISFFVPKDWLNITDKEKFSGISWEKQLTISIFDYLPIYGVLPPWDKAPELPEVLEGDVKFLEYKKGSNYQMGKVEASKDSLIRIPLFDFPGMEVKVDGKKVSHGHDDCRNERYCRGLITFNLPKGNHAIEARLKNTPIRTIGNVITLMGLGVVAVLMLKSVRSISK